MKRIVRLKFQNGLTFDSGIHEILRELTGDYIFIDSEEPDFIIFGPYGNDIPAKGNYVRIGYYCENIIPDMNICEWGFGVVREDEVKNDRYKRIQWHGLDPGLLVKQIDPDEVYAHKTKFCNFLYSNPVLYRNEFFRQMSAYKHIDAPGRCMNNMPAIDDEGHGGKWEIKRRFLLPYKFTVAFESDVYPGYQTEKLYDAMRSNSIPVYCGDPFINEIFNPDSFINAFDYIKISNRPIARFLEKFGQYDFTDYRPGTYHSLPHMVRRKLKTIAKGQKMRILLNQLDYRPLIQRIVELDNDEQLYKEMLAQPWFKNNQVPVSFSSKERWRQIFDLAPDNKCCS